MPPTVNPRRPDILSTNFQREVQSMLFLLNWNCISREELRKNLRRIGMELSDENLSLPEIPRTPIQEPYEDTYPTTMQSPEEFPVAEEVVDYIRMNGLTMEDVAGIPTDAFADIDQFTAYFDSTEEEEVATHGGNE